MAGTFDGHLIEDRSVPLIKLEHDVITLADFNDAISVINNRIDALENDFDSRLLVLEAVHPNILAHLAAPISTAHSGQINVLTQIGDSTIPTTKCAFTVLTLGTGHNQAAYGDHTHVEFASFALAKPSGTGTLAGAGSYSEINIGSVIPNFNVQLSIKRAAGSVDANIGDVWYAIIDNSRFRVYNTGSNNTDTFVWSVV